MRTSRFGPTEREQALLRMEKESFDLLVVGGGVTGCGAALDAASRGLSVALVEQRDFASGTSSRSSKLFHGGLRYLEQFQFGLVREALREQTLMLETLCPHLAKPVSFGIPLTKGLWQRLYLGAGTLLYDLIGGRRALPRHRHLSAAATRKRFPDLALPGLSGAIVYHDAQMDDARHTLTLARTAGEHGAVLASSVRQLDFVEQGGRIIVDSDFSSYDVRRFCESAGNRVTVKAQGFSDYDLRRFAELGASIAYADGRAMARVAAFSALHGQG